MADLYGRNLIENPGAETGDTSGWDVALNVTAVAGGYTGSYCFALTANAQMYQQLTASSLPPDYMVSVAFLPAYDPPGGTSAKAELELQLGYAGGVFKITKVPLRAEAPVGGV